MFYKSHRRKIPKSAEKDAYQDDKAYRHKMERTRRETLVTHNNQTLSTHNKERLLKHERGKERPSHILKRYNMQVEKTKSHLKARIIKITPDFSETPKPERAWMDQWTKMPN